MTWIGCSSPKSDSGLQSGPHTFEVRATDSAGNVDPTPASTTWTIDPGLGTIDPGLGSACGKVTEWIPPQLQQTSNAYLYTPPGDSQAAACVARTPETVPGNASANSYVPSDGELAAFHTALDRNGETPDQSAWYPRYVTGRPGLANPSTDDLIEWAAHKWGVPEDWLRAQYTQESGWNQGAMGDLRTVSSADWQKYPRFSCPNSTQCYQSLGTTQVKVTWDGVDGTGTEPLRWKSTAFNIDYQASLVRFYYDNPLGKRSSWGDSSYRPLDEWGAIGAWFSPYPYNNSGALAYVDGVRQHLAVGDWPR